MTNYPVIRVDASIPPVVTHVFTTAREAVLFWVLSGEADVHVGGRVLTLAAAEAVLVPPGHRFKLDVGAHSIVFPIAVPRDEVPAIENVVRLSVRETWHDWLVHRFARSLGYMRGVRTTPDGLTELLSGAASAHEAANTVGAPPMPTSAEAFAVAKRFVDSPEHDADLAELARSVHVGTRTLQRQFVDETGLSLSHWRAAARIAVSVEHLASGRDIGWVANRVGFATAGGFTRAFRRHTGLAPSVFVRSRATDGKLCSTSLATDVTMSPAPDVPGGETWPRVNDFHVLVWVYRGRARFTVGGRVVTLRRGDAIVLPAGVRNRIDTEPGSLVLPLGSRDSRVPDAGRRFDAVVHFPLESESYLLHTVVANYSRVRPVMHDEHRLIDLACRSAEPALVGAAQDRIRGVVNTIVASVHEKPSEDKHLCEWAQDAGIDARALHDCFVQTVGQTFPRWRSHVRMTLARRYLGEGRTAGEIARLLGYAHSSGFTKVFHETQGMTPTEYRRYGWRESRESVVLA
ncbi:helix-turn-helix domain-containing protein [Rhodococcus sp. NPDC057297]|uniref:helix-turn-helix domain-containing protein n=1 Tax=Rhodococcus sp. NPDC057297 TaxID=3346090 RepID=UPI00362BAF65